MGAKKTIEWRECHEGHEFQQNCNNSRHIEVVLTADGRLILHGNPAAKAALSVCAQEPAAPLAAVEARREFGLDPGVCVEQGLLLRR